MALLSVNLDQVATLRESRKQREPDPAQAAVLAEMAGADAVLINCGGFTYALTLDEAQRELDRIDSAAQAATKAGVSVYAGRGISFKNVLALHELGLFHEYYVGHSITSRAVLKGMEAAVVEMLDVIRTDQPQG
jgi:pyridoxine 5-phosphate synthase